MKCRLDASVCHSKQRWKKDKCRCECNELVDKGVCDNGFIWNPSNCGSECDKLCDIGEYLDYENGKRRKKLVDKLVEECTENTGQVKIARITLAKREIERQCSCALHIVLFPIIFRGGSRINFRVLQKFTKESVTIRCIKSKGFYCRLF